MLAGRRTSSLLRIAFVGILAAFIGASARADLLVGNFFGTAPTVLRYDQTTGAFLGVFVPYSSGGLTFPLGATYGSDGNLYVSNSDGDNVLRYNGSTGAFMNVFATDVEDAAGEAFGPNGNLFVANSSSPGAIMELNGTSGALVSTLLGANDDLMNPEGIAFGPDGNLYVANNDADNVLEFDGTTGAFIGVFASGNGLSHPRGLTFGPDGNLYVSNFGGAPDGGAVLRFNGTTGAFIDNFVTLDDTNVLPRPLTFGPDGDLYLGSFGVGDVLRYDGTTGALVSVFVPAGSGGLGGPTFLLFQDISPVSVPEPSPLTLVVLAGLVGVLIKVKNASPRAH